MTRFRDFDGMARLTLVGSLAAAVAFLLPWATVRARLVGIDFSGTELVVFPAVLDRISSLGGTPAAYAIAILAFVALISALSSLVLIVVPGLQSLSDLNPAAGRGLCAAGLICSLLIVGLLAVIIGPALGTMVITYGALLALLGFAVGAFAWPRAHRLGDDEVAADA